MLQTCIVFNIRDTKIRSSILKELTVIGEADT